MYLYASSFCNLYAEFVLTNVSETEPTLSTLYHLYAKSEFTSFPLISLTFALKVFPTFSFPLISTDDNSTAEGVVTVPPSGGFGIPGLFGTIKEIFVVYSSEPILYSLPSLLNEKSFVLTVSVTKSSLSLSCSISHPHS